MKLKKSNFTIGILSLFLACLLTACGTLGSGADTGKEEAVQTEENAASMNEDIQDIQEQESAASWQVLNKGDEAPDFTASLTDGSTFTLSDQRGKVVLLNFWATWCGPCVREMPAFEQLQEEYSEDAAILAVNCMEYEDIVDAFIEENGYTFPIAYDEEGEIVMKYPSQGIPYTLVIDGEGIIRQIYVGAADADAQHQLYQNAIDTILAETAE